MRKRHRKNPEGEGYQGWKNHETWAINLWIGNDEGLYNMFTEQADELMPSHRAEIKEKIKKYGRNYYKIKTSDGRVRDFVVTQATLDLADSIKDFFEENNPLSGEANVYSDLLGGALQRVDYRQIAIAMFER